MPIRLNLLAEAQAAEEMRRKDPVKRAIWASALAISLMLVWASSLQLKSMMGNREVSRLENQMLALTNDYKLVLENQRKSQEVRDRISALNKLSASRFLQANVLDALQKTYVDDVQLIHLRSEQTYSFTDETKPRTNDTRVIAGKPATVSEKVIVSLDGSDSSVVPGDKVTKYKEALGTNQFFREIVGKPNAISLQKISTPELSVTTGKRSVFFTLECRLPEVTR